MDIEQFLELQTENGDQRRKAYDIFPQVIIPDTFMECVEGDLDWYLFCPYEVKKYIGQSLTPLFGSKFNDIYWRLVEDAQKRTYTGNYKVVKAKALFKHIMRTQLETGLPYLAFKDTINDANPNQHMGYIPQVNLCVESFSNVNTTDQTHTCNLVSLNLANIYDIEYYSRIAVEILDATIDLTNPPIESSTNHNNLYRTIGVGAMGLADWVAKNHLQFTDTVKISNLFEDIAYYCTHQSMEIAKVKGAFPAFDGSSWSKGRLLGNKSVEDIRAISSQPERWTILSEEIQKYGIRNSHIMAIAPNTSSSLLQGCTASILPAYSKFYYDKNGKGTTPIAPPFIKDNFWFYRENKNINQNIITDYVSIIQFWIDTGISMELLFNLNEGAYGEGSISAKDIFFTLIGAWKKGCKAVYYIRSVQKDSFSEKRECTTCAN